MLATMHVGTMNPLFPLPFSRSLQAKASGQSFELGYDPNRCLTPDQITIAQADFASEISNREVFRKVLELGVGSGVFLSHMLLDTTNPGLHVRGIDIDPQALLIAQHNLSRVAKQRGFPISSFSLDKGDWLSKEPVKDTPDVDMIYANPPYLPEGAALRPEFVQNPHHSLFAPDEGMAHYSTIIRQSKEHLKDGGYLFLRTSNNQARTDAVGEMLVKGMRGSQIGVHTFQSEHRHGTGYLVKFIPSEI